MSEFKYIILFSLLLTCSFGFSQKKVTDKRKKVLNIPAEPSKIERDTIPVKIKVAPELKDLNQKKSNPKSDNSNKNEFKISDKPFSMIATDGLKSSGEIFEKRWKKELEKGGVIRTMSDQFLGEHKVDTKFVNIVCRDHGYPDGDRVKIHINGYVSKENLLLTNNYRRVSVNLIEGKNTVEIEALNQGESGPNTAEFLVYDDKGNLISSKEWNLLTGVKAIIIFNNEKPVIKEKGHVEAEDKTVANSN